MQTTPKQYELTVWFPQHDEWDCDSQSFDTLQECVDYVNHFHIARNPTYSDITINGKSLRVCNGRVVGKDGKPFCTNQKWHDIFAEYDYPRIKAAWQVADEIATPLNRPSHGATNPATLATLGVL